jgi:hypothetical protein
MVMARFFAAALAAVVAVFAVGACAPAKTELAFRTPPQPRGLTCDTATAKVLTFGRSTARLYADIALKQQVGDLRGYMFNAGLRRIQVVQQTNDCVTASAGGVVGNLYQCTARAQMCGR